MKKNDSKTKLLEEENDNQNINNNQNCGILYYNYDYEIDQEIVPYIFQEIKSQNKFPDEEVERYYKCESDSICSKNCIKEIVSEGRIRMHRRNYDLDLVYITKKVIAMGYPATGCESLYRNSLKDVKQFLREEHGRIYCTTLQKFHCSGQIPFFS